MFCTNCGSKIEDGNVFCPNCGAAIMAEEPAEAVRPELVQAAPEAQEGFTLSSTEEVPAKKKAPKWVLPTAIVAAVAVVVAVVVAFLTGGSAHLSGPEHLQKVEGAVLGDVADALTNVYGTAMDAMGQTPSGSMNVSLSVRPGDGVLDLVEKAISDQSGADVDLSWLSNVSLSMDTNVQEEMQQIKLALMLGNTNLLTASFINDLKEELMYVGIPTLSDVFLEMDVADLGDVITVRLPSSVPMDLEGLPSEEELNSLLKKYIDIFLGAIEDVDKTKQTVELDGLKQECYVLTVKLSQEDLLKIAKVCLEEAVDDKTLKSVIEAYSDWYNETQAAMYEDWGYAWEEVDYYDYFQDSVEDLLDQMDDLLDDADSSTAIKFTTYVDKKDNIIGREIKLSDAGVKLSYLTVTQNGKFAFEADLGSVTVEGSGTNKSNKLTGEYVLEYQGEEYITVEVKDFDQKALDDGYINGTFKFIPNEDLLSDMLGDMLGDYGSYAMLADLALEVSVESSEKSTAAVVDILSGDDSLLAIELKVGSGSTGDIRVPSDTVNISDEEELMEWIGGLDFDALLKNLEEAGVPDEWVDMLESLMSNMGGSSAEAAPSYAVG